MGGTRDPRTRDLLRFAPPPVPPAEPQPSGSFMGGKPRGITAASARSFDPVGVAAAAVRAASEPAAAPASGASPYESLVTWYIQRAAANGVPISRSQALLDLFDESGQGLSELGSLLLGEFAGQATAVPKAASSDRGFAPQSKSSGTLSNGRPYIFDPNAAPGSQFYDGITGGYLSPTDFAALPQQVQGNDGYLYFIDPQTKTASKGPLIGFAEIDPVTKAAADKLRFDTEEGGRNRRNTESEQSANQRSLLAAQSAGFTSLTNAAPQLATAAQNQAQFVKDTISSPADLAYRMFSTRGGTSPFPRVTQADLINNLAAEVERYNQVLQSYRPGPVGFQPQNSPQAGFAEEGPVLTSAQQADANRTAAMAGTPLQAQADAAAWARTPGFTSPTQPAPITLNPTTGQWEQAGQPVGGFEQASARVAQQMAPTPAQQFTAPQAAPSTQAGFSVAPPSFQVPQIPVPQRTTQAELQGFEQQSRPPAVRSILEGNMPKPLDLGFSLPTPQMYGSLTPDERKAFGSTLAIQYDVSPEDYETAIQKRFGRTQERTAARVGF